MSSRFLVALIATGMSTLKVVGILVALRLCLQRKEGGGRARKENPKCGGSTFLTV